MCPKRCRLKIKPNLTTNLDQAQAKFELGIALALYNWDDLTVAVQNGWGGPESADKRDFLAGSIAELFESNSETDGDDVADRLVQFMEDEFEVVVDDNSEVQVAATIMKIKLETLEGKFGMVDQLYEGWKEKKDSALPPVQVQSQSDDEDSVDDEDLEEQDGDTKMTDASVNGGDSISKKEKPPPEVDEDGFTKVVRKKRG